MSRSLPAGAARDVALLTVAFSVLGGACGAAAGWLFRVSPGAAAVGGATTGLAVVALSFREVVRDARIRRGVAKILNGE